ncbi:MAG: signal peptidase II [Clostridiales Family XIII bacterium]|jgi:signal peptidase II|nr:signal peptidase II [Clostridiales Family XIII bacterium]
MMKGIARQLHYIVIIAIVGLDQLSKYIVRSNMSPSDQSHDYGMAVIPGIFDITFVKNTGAAFSILQGKLVFLTVFNCVVIAVLTLFLIIRAEAEARRFVYGVSLIIAGGLGNLVDRVSLGYVTDFFDFQIFPVFNVADISVCVGCGLVIMYMVAAEFGKKKKVKESVEVDGNSVE